MGSTFGVENSVFHRYDGLNVSDCHDSCQEEEGSGSPYPRNACECSNSVFYAERELGIDCNLSRILYYYHPDYLGHNEYISDITGRPYRYFHYSAFGESLIERNTNYGQFSSPYRFNGKKLDPETGNYYYGTRYYNPVWGIWLGVDPLAHKYPSMSPFVFTGNNPIMLVDPDGRDIIPIHGTWSDNSTWGNLSGIRDASQNLFGDNRIGAFFSWSGDNYRGARKDAAMGLIEHVRVQMQSEAFNGSITLVGHSHGGNVAIEALNLMTEMKEFDEINFNLLTINTPVRSDYQLTEKALDRLNHVNVYDELDFVQSNGGNSVRNRIVGLYSRGVQYGYRIGQMFLSGEFGDAGRKFDSAENISVDNPQGIGGDFHNSHNRVNDWIDKLENE